MPVRQRRAQPWWAAGGSEVCAICGQAYLYEMERRCAECDAPMCFICATKNATDEIVCSACIQVPSER